MYKISVIQVLRLEPKNSLPNYEKIISENNLFLQTHNVEYIIYDNLKSFDVLKFIKNTPHLKYFRKDFSNSRNSFLESGMLSSGEKIIFLKSEDILSVENVERLEKERPNILKKDLKKISNLKKSDFHYDDFNLLIKENKTFFEKLKTLFI